MWKPVNCENCGCEYTYQIKHQTNGSATNVLWLNKEGAIRNAENNANQNLESYLNKAVRNYHCPDCGFYQSEMIQNMKNTIWQRALVFGFIALIIIVIVAASSSYSLFYSIIGGLIVSIAFLSPLTNFNPNAKAHTRINQKFSESYPVKKKEKTQFILADSIVEIIKPFGVELIQRVTEGEELETVARSIAKRANVSLNQVLAFAFILSEGMKGKKSK